MWNDLFSSVVERIRKDADALMEAARTLNSFRFHRVCWAYHQIKLSAANLREAADRLDEMAERLPQDERTAA